jgi:hypothetical protein
MISSEDHFALFQIMPPNFAGARERAGTRRGQWSALARGLRDGDTVRA